MLNYSFVLFFFFKKALQIPRNYSPESTNNTPWENRTSVPGQYFADTAVADAQPAGDVTGTHAAFGKLHDALPQHKR